MLSLSRASRFGAPLAMALLIATPAAWAQSQSEAEAGFAERDVEAIETIIRNYLIENPEVLVEAMAAYEAKREQAEAQARQAALADAKEEIFDDPLSPVVGDPDADVTIVEFFDYRCPYCKVTAARLQALIDEDPGVRLVMKEFPILSAESEVAARAALAAAKQDRYEAFHFALMAQPGDLSERHLRAIAKGSQVDADQMFADMEDPALKEAIRRNHELGRRLNIRGTPALVIGDQVVPGAVDEAELRALVAAVRASDS